MNGNKTGEKGSDHSRNSDLHRWPFHHELRCADSLLLCILPRTYVLGYLCAAAPRLDKVRVQISASTVGPFHRFPSLELRTHVQALQASPHRRSRTRTPPDPTLILNFGGHQCPPHTINPEVAPPFPRSLREGGIMAVQVGHECPTHTAPLLLPAVRWRQRLGRLGRFIPDRPHLPEQVGHAHAGKGFEQGRYLRGHFGEVAGDLVHPGGVAVAG